MDDNSNASKGAQLHRAQLRFSGSMCLSCLLDFQEKLGQIYGVERARVERSEQVALQTASPVLINWADGLIYYDANKLDFQDLRAYVRTLGYVPYKVVDKEVCSVPALDPKKPIRSQ
ncbi:MAG: hypothetical protein K2X27_20130 [Candidatus Obscuribacterales bacterium]|nr:hypothetical protein [Candidatus Obscuribacterales bacterium]